MKRIIFYLLLSTLIQTNIFAGMQNGLAESDKPVLKDQWGTVVYNTQVSISPKQPTQEYKANQPIDLLVRIRNLSTNEGYSIYVQNSFIFTEGLSLVVLSPSGKDISPSFQHSIRGSGAVVRVNPLQTDGFSFDLHEICKMEEIGTYQVISKVRRWTPDKRKSFEIPSERLKVTTVP